MKMPSKESRERLRRMMTSANDVAVDRIALQDEDLDTLRALLDGYERRGALLDAITGEDGFTGLPEDMQDAVHAELEEQ